MALPTYKVRAKVPRYKAVGQSEPYYPGEYGDGCAVL